MGEALRSEDVAWTPTPKQAEFLAAPEFEVLYGGGVGSGKTDGLLIDALGLQHGAITFRGYQAVIFRRSYKDLKDIIDRSHEIYKDFAPGARYDKQEHVWTFPDAKEVTLGGGKVEFAFIDRDIERLRYRGRAFQYVGWEELTLWPTEVPYKYLMSRIRSRATLNIPLYCRATTNADGPGFKWAKERFRIPESGRATRFEYELEDIETGEKIVRTRRYIPAKLSDNPHVGVEYRANLADLDRDDQERLVLGLWKQPKVKGAIYAAEMAAVHKEGRVGKVPYQQGIPVNTFWDFGLSTNGTTAIWCHQRVALQDRFLRTTEGANKPLAYFVEWLLDTGFVFGTHYLPHDAAIRRLGTHDTKSYEDMLKELLPGHKFVVVPRIDDVNVGIAQTRDKFNSCWFNDGDEGCEDGVSALENYRRKYNEEAMTYGDPLHDWACNYADAFRQFGQALVSVDRKRPRVSPGRAGDSTAGY